MIVLVTGGRNRDDSKFITSKLDEHHAVVRIKVLIQGGATGVDQIAYEWALSHGIHSATIEAQWERYGKSAGARRNMAMLRLRPTQVLAFPSEKSPGTKECVLEAVAQGIPCIVYTHDGKVLNR